MKCSRSKLKSSRDWKPDPDTLRWGRRRLSFTLRHQRSKSIPTAGVGTMQVSAPGDPQSNGAAENAVKYLKGKDRTLRTAADAPQNLWTFSMAYAARIHNLLPKTKTMTKGPDGGPTTPHWLITGQTPDVSSEHAWFSECWAHVKDQDRVEDERAVRANFIGRARNTKGFLIRDVESRRIFVARTVIFNEKFTSRTPGTFAGIRFG